MVHPLRWRGVRSPAPRSGACCCAPWTSVSPMSPAVRGRRIVILMAAAPPRVPAALAAASAGPDLDRIPLPLPAEVRLRGALDRTALAAAVGPLGHPAAALPIQGREMGQILCRGTVGHLPGNRPRSLTPPAGACDLWNGPIPATGRSTMRPRSIFDVPHHSEAT